MPQHRSPATGIHDIAGFTTDGILAGFVGIALSGLDVDYSGDDGGWEIVASGMFPTYVNMYVDFINPNDPTEIWRCYSGIPGQGDEVASTDGGSITFWHPPMPVGEDYILRVTTVDATLTATLTSALDIWKRSYTTNLYSIRSALPAPRAVGGRSPFDEEWDVGLSGRQAVSGGPVSAWSVLISAMADTLYETRGFLLTRLWQELDPDVVDGSGYAIVRVEGAHRWPESGRVVIDDQLVLYDGLSPYFEATPGPTTDHYVTLEKTTDADGNPIEFTARKGVVCMYFGKDTTDIDILRRSFYVEFAVGADLDMLGRQYGIYRPRGMTDATFRALLKVLIYLAAQTIEGIEKVMDVIRGPGNYEVYELFPTPGEFNRVYIQLTAVAGDNPRGKSYLVGLEALAQTTATTVTATHAPLVVSGVWDSADPYREGVNYCEEGSGVIETADDKLYAPLFWQVGDEGRSVRMAGGAIWTILSYLDPDNVQVGSAFRSDGTLNSGSPLELKADENFFREWMIGHSIVIPSGVNAGTHIITGLLNERTVLCAASAFATETDVTYRLKPVFTGTATSMTVFRATIAGSVITTPIAMPANVLVDYTTTPSAEVMSGAAENGEGQFPLYLFDDTFTVALLLDLITAAGVEPVLETI